MRQTLTILLFILSIKVAPTDKRPVIGYGYSELSPKITEMLSDYDTRVESRFNQVDSLRSKLANTSDDKMRVALTREIIAEYETLSFDSLTNFCTESQIFADKLPGKEFKQWLTLTKAKGDAQKGAAAEALTSVLNEIGNGIHETNRRSAFGAVVKITLAAASLYDEPIASRYRAIGRQYIDSLRNLSHDGSVANTLLSGIANDIDGRTHLASADYIEVIRSPRSNSAEISRAAYLLSRLYRQSGQLREAGYYLELSALYDLTSIDLTGPALPHLGFAMIDSGKTDLGRTYLTTAFKNASVSGDANHARLFTKKIPDILDGYYSDAGNAEWRNISIIIILITALALSAVKWTRSSKRNSSLRLNIGMLNESISAKDKSLGSFIDISAGILERQEEFIRLIRRKLAASQVEDVIALIRDRRPYDSSEDEILNIFDKAFTTAFPNFVSELNRLFEPTKRITTGAPHSLTPELRVAAMARLGVNDATKVSRLLCLSLNTVYTYRNKLKSRAISRETFDTDIENLS